MDFADLERNTDENIWQFLRFLLIASLGSMTEGVQPVVKYFSLP
jgi:hypothetical protein